MNKSKSKMTSSQYKEAYRNYIKEMIINKMNLGETIEDVKEFIKYNYNKYSKINGYNVECEVFNNLLSEY